MPLRSKTTDETKTGPGGWTVTRYGSPYSSGGGDIILGSNYSSYAGHDTSQFHARKKRGELLASTPFTQFTLNGLRTETYYDYTTVNGEWRSYGHHNSVVGNWEFTEGELGDIVNQYVTTADSLVQAAAAKVYSQGFDSLTFLAELNKTLSMFKSAKRSLLSLLSGGTKSHSLADLWLQYRYGWRILYYEMQDVSKALAMVQKSRSRYSQTVGKTFSQDTSDTVLGENSVLYRSSTITSLYEINVKGHVTADISPPSFAFNPLTTAWELITYSFIIDWFYNVGNSLEALSFSALATDYSAHYTIHVKANRETESTVTGWKPGCDGSWPEASSCEATFVVRTPTKVRHRPYFGINFDVAKGLDLIAISRALKKLPFRYRLGLRL